MKNELEKILDEIGYYEINVDENFKISIKYSAKAVFKKEKFKSDWHKMIKFYFEKYPNRVEIDLNTVPLIKEVIEDILENKEILEEMINLI